MTRSWKLQSVATMLAIAGVVAAGCGGDDGGTKPDGGGSPITLPLTLGNQWSYTVASTVGGDTDTYPRIDEVTGTEQFEGQTYAVLRTIVEGPVLRSVSLSGLSAPLARAPLADTTEIYIRQSGQKLFAYSYYDTAGVGNEIQRYVFNALNESAPWEVADFASSPGSAKTLLDLEQTFEIQGGTLELDINFTARNEGRVSVTVPKATYSDVQRARLIQTLVFKQNTPPLPPITQTLRLTQDLYVKDGVGIVKEWVEASLQQTGADPEVETDEASLTDYTLHR